MGNSLLKLFTIFLFLQGGVAFGVDQGKERIFQIEKASFSLEFDDSWRATKDLFGLPLVLSGPVENSSRPIISITPTPFDKAKFDHRELKDDQKDYEKERREWISKKGGEVLEFDKIQRVKFKAASGYRVGYHYEINDHKFSEGSYYLICKKRLYHLKYLVKGDQSKYLKSMKDIIGSFQCK